MHASTEGSAAQTALSAGSTPQPIQEFLAFKLGDEEYGMDILRVQEIRSYEAPTRMANTPPFLKGVINLRGVIVPIIDLRLQFGLTEVRYDEFTGVIVLNIGSRVVGIVVDGVSDVIALSAEQQRAVPEMTGNAHSDCLLAIGSVAQRMILLLDIEKLMNSPAMGLLSTSIH